MTLPVLVRRPGRLLLGVSLAVVLAACGASGASPSGDPASAPPASVDPGPAIDTDTLVADATLDGQTVRVNGFFLATERAGGPLFDRPRVVSAAVRRWHRPHRR